MRIKPLSYQIAARATALGESSSRDFLEKGLAKNESAEARSPQAGASMRLTWATEETSLAHRGEEETLSAHEKKACFSSNPEASSAEAPPAQQAYSPPTRASGGLSSATPTAITIRPKTTGTIGCVSLGIEFIICIKKP